MIKIARGIGFVAALALSLLSQAIAGEVAVPSQDALRMAIQKNKDSIAMIQTKFRDVRCPQQPKNLQMVCEGAYKMLTARLDAARAELELIQTAASLPEPARSQIIGAIQNPARFNKYNAENGALGDQVYLLFPVPRQSSER